MSRTRQPRRGIYLLPTLFTVGNLFCGFASLIYASQGRMEPAALLVVVAAVLDGLDGRIARLTGASSAFGLEFDSMADTVSFGVAPAFLYYHWGLQPLDRVGWLVAFLYVVCAAMRLARFNIGSVAVPDKRWFIGLPSPMAGIVMACVVFAFPVPLVSDGLSTLIAVFTLCVSILMVSKLRYRSFKELDLRDRRSYIYVLPLAASVVAIALYPKAALLPLSAAYLLSAPVVYLWSLLRRPGGPARPERGSERETADGGVVDEPVFR